MKKLSGWIKVFRMHDALFSVGILYISLYVQPFFNNLNKSNLIIFLIIIFLGVCVAMAQNDWFDRKKDLRQGKRFASEHARSLLIVNLIIWLVTGYLIIKLKSTEFTVVIALLLIHYYMSLIYSLFQRVIFLPTTVVALSVGSLMLYAYFFPGTNNSLAFGTFVILTLIIFIREIIKDLEDIGTDKGYKSTIPIRFGIQKSIKTIMILLTVVSLLMIVFKLPNLLTLFPVMLTVMQLKKNKFHDAKVISNFIMIFFFLILWLL